MCIVSAEAKLSNTRILSMPLDNGRHLLSYSNKAKNLSGKTNSMILAIPGEVNEDWFYDTTNYNKFLGDIEDQAHLGYDASHGILSRGMKSLGDDLSFEKFNVGMYTILTTKNLRATLNAEENSGIVPEVSEELINFFHNHYKDWSYVICIFGGSEEMDSQPITFEYAPTHPDWLYFPTMDSHTGGAPILGESISMDHTLIYEYPGLRSRVVHNMKFSQDVPEILKRRNYVSTKWDESKPNGDMYIHVPSLNKYAKDKEFCYDGFNRTPVHPGSTVIA